jgi:hydroxymethylbilane synthase
MHTPVRLGTRSSKLALAQTTLVQHLLKRETLVVPMTTSGDKILDIPLYDVGGKALFCKELDHALLNNDVDIAVHSLKDVPTELPHGLVIGAVLPRTHSADALVSKHSLTLEALPKGAVIGTSSLRRQAQLLAKRPDLLVKSIRGNVPTRLQKLETEDFDAIILAMAGLERLNLTQHATQIFTADVMLPAASQGVIAILYAAHRADIAAMLAPLNDLATAACITAERAVLLALEANCKTPVAAFAEINSEHSLILRAFISLEDGSQYYTATATGLPSDAFEMGKRVGHDLIAQAGIEFMKTVRR